LGVNSITGDNVTKKIVLGNLHAYTCMNSSYFYIMVKLYWRLFPESR